MTDPLADALDEAYAAWWESGRAKGHWLDALARAAREHIAAEIEREMGMASLSAHLVGTFRGAMEHAASIARRQS